ncbi:hypothetical protein OESDEN_03615 [Oesophagostomum dentatum]|uniref:Uncharacterized protein n=1 Tax=Oesophagostomum dentatum TaxID=61180 RepID=A0A0B1TJY6_OESDE|nr:hypothetical protein OESDEN_03615 [Oesophagostomum dentatum]
MTNLITGKNYLAIEGIHMRIRIVLDHPPRDMIVLMVNTVIPIQKADVTTVVIEETIEKKTMLTILLRTTEEINHALTRATNMIVVVRSKKEIETTITTVITAHTTITKMPVNGIILHTARGIIRHGQATWIPHTHSRIEGVILWIITVKGSYRRDSNERTAYESSATRQGQRRNSPTHALTADERARLRIVRDFTFLYRDKSHGYQTLGNLFKILPVDSSVDWESLIRTYLPQVELIDFRDSHLLSWKEGSNPEENGSSI